MQNTYVRFPNWSKCRTVESNKAQQLCRFWRSLQLRNGKIKLSLKGFNFWTVGYCKGWHRADWHISECTFAPWGEGVGEGDRVCKRKIFFFLSLNLLIGWRLSIWICWKPFLLLLYNCQLLGFWQLALSIVVKVFPQPFFQILLLEGCILQTHYA